MVAEGRLDGDMVLDQYPGSGLSISELCHALKLKLAQTRDSRKSFPLPLVKSLLDDISTTVGPLRRVINYHDSWTHRFPPEILVAVACHLGDDASLIDATHVCHFWRTTLLSYPRLWSHPSFTDEGRALLFLERSKSVPLSVDLTPLGNPSEIVRESLKKITTRVTTLWAVHDSLLDELLGQSMPMLEHLEILDSDELPPKKPTHLPALTSLVVHGFDPLRFHAPTLTSFHLAHDPTGYSQEWATSILLSFLQSCPLLEIAFFSCDVHPDSDEVVSLPLLRSFTHETPDEEYQLCLLNQLSLPSSCQVVLVIDVSGHYPDPWIHNLLTPKDSPYLSDIRSVKISARSRTTDSYEDHVTFRTELVNSTRKTISFDRVSYCCGGPSHLSGIGFLDIFGSVETGSIETLCFYRYPVHTPHVLRDVAPERTTRGMRNFRNLKTLILVDCNIELSLDCLSLCPTVDTLVVHSSHLTGPPNPTGVGIVGRMEEFAISRKKAGSPLRVLTLVFPFAKPRPLELERLMGCVGRVEVLTGGDAIYWNLDEYILSATTYEEDISRH